jgi:CheY-like chemotaxis protein
MANVLVVDDEEVYRTYLSGWLTRDGHEVQIASNGQEAIEIGKAFPPDVLIVDWMLKNEYYGLQERPCVHSSPKSRRSSSPASPLRVSGEKP